VSSTKPTKDPQGGATEASRVVCHLDQVLHDRGMTLTELSHRIGLTVVNLSILKNDRAKAVRFATLTAICDALHCQPGDLFSVQPPPSS
jgi:putative transcriptional regulator